MAGAANVLSDDSLLSRLDRGLHKVEGVMALLSGLTVMGLMVLAVISVSGRNFFAQPLPGYVDIILLAMPFIAILGVAYTQRDGGHIRMDIVVGALSGRVLWAVEFLTTLVVLVVVVLLIWGSWAHFDRSFDSEMPRWSTDSTIDIGLPIWPAKLIVPVSFSILALRLALQLWGYGRAFLGNLPTPVAVPLVQSAAEQAAEEALHVSGLEER